MKELLRRLSLCPRVAWEILAASLLANLMSLGSSIYVILVLNRYVGYGFDGTLYTLTAGVLIASGLGFAFGEVRMRLAGVVSLAPDEELAEKTLATLSRARLNDLNRMPAGRHQEMLGALHHVQGAFDAANVSAILDAPFMVIFLLAMGLISPWLMLLTFVAVCVSAVLTLSGLRKGEEGGLNYQLENQNHRNFVGSAITGAETVRAFLAGEFIRRAWRAQVAGLASLRAVLDKRRAKNRLRMESVSTLLRVFIYAVGAMLAVAGDMSVGGLIGASILSSKVLQMTTSFLQAFEAARRGEQALERLAEFHAMPLEPLSGAALRQFSGRLEFRDVGFAYSGTASPLFESLNFTLAPGTVLCVTGLNGAGKSTFCKLASGILEPGRGQVLADGVDLRQLAPDWWRRQVLYMPQEPSFLNTSIRANITLADPDPDGPACQERLSQAVRAAALRRFLDATREGLDMPVLEGGRSLPLGIRRRIALARALMNPGKLVIFDDPTEGLDSEGCLAVYAILNALAKAGATIIVSTADVNILKGAAFILDMNQKPTPAYLPAPARAAQAEPKGGEA
ncbi:MAG: ATP-binding cassette domain-containing protein [Desulfovibrio sp.]|jgi:ATP-binding cassette subfamily C protein LapB|nr:ATP-binding cassette domain-containing protein [Desulfovibrio sp.]